MSQPKFEIGDVVSYKFYEHIEEAIGIVVNHYDSTAVYLNWISAPDYKLLHWHHPDGDFIGDVQYMTKITHIEDPDAPIQK